MDRLQVYNTRTLVAVEFASAPSSLAALGGRGHVFRRLDFAETAALHHHAVQTTTEPMVARQMQGLMEVVKDRIAYWEKLVPPGLKCFVHHVRFDDEAGGKAGYAAAVAAFPKFAMIGLYAIDPIISMFPRPFRSIPRRTSGGLARPTRSTRDSLFFLNFFPPQPFLREQVVQGTTAIYCESAPGLYHTNNYVDLVSDLFTSAARSTRSPR